MSAIVNQRDIILQGATQRIAETVMTPGVVVKQDQVEGLGLVVLDSKLVTLSATSQVFRIGKAEASATPSVEPASISLTPTIKGLPPNIVFAVTAGNAALSYANGGAILAYDDMLTDAVTIRASVSDATKAYFDDITIVKVREGSDALTGMLTNESHTVPADYLNNALNLNGAEGFFRVYLGATEITSACTFSVAAASPGVTTSINLQGKYIVDNVPAGPQSVTVTYRATFGAVVLDKTFSISKSRQGQPGPTGAGTRGSMTFYVEVADTVWSDTVANTATQTTGTKILNDVVQQYNNVAGWTETRFWDGNNWLRINAVIDGNLLVRGTVGAEKISANAINTTHITAGAITGTKLAVGAITAQSAAIQSLDAAKITVGTLNAARIGAGTITANMIVSKSCTSLEYMTRRAPNGWQRFDFYMDQQGYASVIGTINIAWSGVSPVDETVYINIDGQLQEGYLAHQHEASFTLMTGLNLTPGWHAVNVYAECTRPSSVNHAFYLSLFRSYR